MMSAAVVALFATLAAAVAVKEAHIDVDALAAPPVPKQCFNSSVCTKSNACIFPTGSCGFDGSAGYCMQKFNFCPQNYNPVCGCDGKTYGNACMAQSAGQSIQYSGACVATPHCYANTQCNQTNSEFCQRPVGSCGGSFANGNCTQMPQLCTLQWQPVCGCDGNTYPNECQAQSVGVSTAFNGFCRTPGCSDNTACQSTEFCEFKPQGTCNGTGSCAATPQLCPAIYQPCCGCDGITYSNVCYANVARTNCAASGPCP